MTEFLIERGYNVLVIDNLSTGRLENLKHIDKNLEIIECDLSSISKDAIEGIKESKYVFHLASLADIVPSIEDPMSYYNSNVTGTVNVMEAAKNSKTKIVYAASSSCYGIAEEYPTPETARVKPEYPYALTKRRGEEIVLHWSKVYKIKAVSTRFFNVYGTRSRTSGTYGAVFGVFLAQKLANKPLTIVGDGEQTRDFSYVTDVCKGMMLAAESKYENEIFNIGSGEPQSINRLAELIGGEKIYIPERPGEPKITHANIEKARRLLKYNPEISFEEGVNRVIENISYWKDAPVWTPEKIEKVSKAWFDSLSAKI